MSFSEHLAGPLHSQFPYIIQAQTLLQPGKCPTETNTHTHTHTPPGKNRKPQFGGLAPPRGHLLELQAWTWLSHRRHKNGPLIPLLTPGSEMGSGRCTLEEDRPQVHLSEPRTHGVPETLGSALSTPTAAPYRLLPRRHRAEW